VEWLNHLQWLFGITPKIQEPVVPITIRFDAKRVKMNNLQLYGNDFVKSASNKMSPQKSMVLVTNPSHGCASVKLLLWFVIVEG